MEINVKHPPKKIDQTPKVIFHLFVFDFWAGVSVNHSYFLFNFYFSNQHL